MSKQKENVTKKFKDQLIELLNEGPMIPGSIKKQWNVCGMPGCRCKDPKNPQKHGPYFQLSFTLAGKSTSMFVKEEEFEQMSEATERYHKFKSLSLQLVQSYVNEERAERANRSRSKHK
jgi:hypothetical protein